MAESDAKIADILVDCSDPELLASFWAELLGRPIAGRMGPYVWLQYSEAAPGFGFQKVSQPKTGKNRMHIDISVSDVAATKVRIEALGGWRVTGYERGGFLVMADPEGNEFCVIPSAPFHFDDDGRADYLDNLNI
jgi:predicted enzyme related to lactoylglutathione lyase